MPHPLAPALACVGLPSTVHWLAHTQVRGALASPKLEFTYTSASEDKAVLAAELRREGEELAGGAAQVGVLGLIVFFLDSFQRFVVFGRPWPSPTTWLCLASPARSHLPEV